ncbi:MAG: helix-turn-helix domain-containing protein [Elusimicrobia bacterium]|nr:helix-turn-helix domain-containing protein [Elusimicrobiota bacterium]
MGKITAPFLNVQELAMWLHVKVSTIRKRVCYNRIPYIRIGRSVRFRQHDIEEWLNAQNGASGGPK